MAVIASLLLALPAHAARPLLDKGQWDAYFALFARDAYASWKTTTVRLDTYSGAPVDFSAYEVDVADVVIAGQNLQSRAIDTAHRKPVVRWRFTPPPGYQFEANDVNVPLEGREGFFVIEARRGDAVQQVWVNRTRVGLLSKEGPEGILLYGADLQTGKRLRNMRISLLVGAKFEERHTDDSGIVRWTDYTRRPIFALAEFGGSKAFVSFLPQPPVPSALVVARVDNAAIHAGDRVRVVGFARKRTAAVFRPATGDVHVVINGRGRTIVSESAHLDSSGAYVAEITIPANTESGDYAVLASSSGATGGTSLHVDALAGDLALAVTTDCSKGCSGETDLPLVVTARRAGAKAAGVTVAVHVVRSPHIVVRNDRPDVEAWGTSPVLDASAITDAAGEARFRVAAPTDGLASTYGVEASSGAATATTSIKMATGKIALSLFPDRASLDVGEPANVQVRAFDPIDGSPVGDIVVTLRASHGTSASEQQITLGRDGRATATMRNLPLGNVLLTAQAQSGSATVMDAYGVTVRPRVLGARASLVSSEIAITLDRKRYGPKERVEVSAQLAGAVGDALFTLEGTKPVDARTVAVNGGRANTQLALTNAAGDVRVGAAFVRNGALLWATQSLNVDGAGRPLFTTLSSDRASYGPAEVAKITIEHGYGAAVGTLIVRLSDALASGSADFDAVSDVLRAGATTTQDPASEEPGWHVWVAPARSKASDIFAFERRGTSKVAAANVGAAATKTLLFKVEHGERGVLSVPLPSERGRYVLSLIDISEDGDVGAASLSLTVR